MIDYFKYKSMIMKAAWQWAKKCPKVNFEEFICQGNLIFVEAMDSFDSAKASFSTHLTIQLRRLKDFAEYEYRRMPVSVASFNEELVEVPYDVSDKTKRLIKTAKQVLTPDAFEVFFHLISFTWYQAGNKRTPTKNSMLPTFRQLGWKINRFTEAWETLEIAFKGGHLSI